MSDHDDNAMLPPAPFAAPDTLALLLDFDGTLVEIAPRPDAITVPPDLPGRLARLHDRLSGALAVVSGRAVADLRGYLPDFPGLILGSHGAERAEAGAEPLILAPTDGLAELRAETAVYARQHPALLVEDKTHSVVLHYRAAPGMAAQVAAFMQGLAARHPAFAVQPAKMAVELRPAGADKGSAVARLLDTPPFAGRVAVYAGDDTTDEAAMQVAQDRGGAGIKIGPGETVATYRMDGPADLYHWLDRAV